MVNVKGLVSVGIPDITPAVLRVKPVGSAPPASFQLYDPVPPVAVRVCELPAYKLSLGSEVVDIVKEGDVVVLPHPAKVNAAIIKNLPWSLFQFFILALCYILC